MNILKKEVMCRPSKNPEHESERAEIARLTREFLAKGGEIKQADSGHTALPFRLKRSNEDNVSHLRRRAA
ncbi:MAG: hypothetical protein ACSHWQ_07555 [Spongiibacteraceae bacterium]